MTSLNRWREFLKMEYPRYYWNPNYEPWLPSDTEMPKAGDSIPRAIAKAIYGHYYYGEDKSLEKELDDFVASINRTKLPSLVLVFFSMAGGTGSGMVVDLARHLSNVKLGRRIPVVGVAAMPFSGDEEHVGGAAALYPTMNEIDCMLDDAKNQGVMAVWGDLYKNPFTGGFFALPQEHSWQRLGSYTKTGQAGDPGRPAQGRHPQVRERLVHPLRGPGLRPAAVQDAAPDGLHRRPARAQHLRRPHLDDLRRGQVHPPRRRGAARRAAQQVARGGRASGSATSRSGRA